MVGHKKNFLYKTPTWERTISEHDIIQHTQVTTKAWLKVSTIQNLASKVQCPESSVQHFRLESRKSGMQLPKIIPKSSYSNISQNFTNQKTHRSSYLQKLNCTAVLRLLKQLSLTISQIVCCTSSVSSFIVFQIHSALLFHVNLFLLPNIFCIISVNIKI